MEGTAAKGRTRHPVRGSFFVAKPRPGSVATSIPAPTAATSELDERANELRLVGQVGTRVGKGSVDSTGRDVHSCINPPWWPAILLPAAPARPAVSA
jgi:hypothetical protein